MRFSTSTFSPTFTVLFCLFAFWTTPLSAQISAGDVSAGDLSDSLQSNSRSDLDRNGTGRLHGTVFDSTENPLPEAEIRLWRESRPDAPEKTQSDAQGRWMLHRLAVGTWQIMVIGPEHHAAIGHVILPPGGRERVDVTLRPLAEVRTLGAESPLQVGAWLERGNILLRQGFPAVARVEYESALAALPAESQGEVLRTIAHTYFLEKNIEQAVHAVQRALLRDPADDLARRLLLVLLEDQGRAKEAQAWLARLDAEGPEAWSEEIEMPSPGTLFRMPPLPDAPIVTAQSGHRGIFRTTFSKRDSLSALDVFLKRYGIDRGDVLASDPQAAAYDLSRESVEMVVPESYEHDSSRPWGLMVWVSPTPWGGVRSEENRQVLEERRILWVGANRSGNGRNSWDRIGLALDAASALQELYEIDPRRVYVGGYSGGGRIATALALLYPERFRGGFLAFGANYYREASIPHQPGSVWPAAFPAPPRKSLKRLREETRLVFLTGELDFNRVQSRLYHRLYEKDGFRHAVYLEIPGGDHYSGVPAEWLGKVLDGLDP